VLAQAMRSALLPAAGPGVNLRQVHAHYGDSFLTFVSVGVGALTIIFVACCFLDLQAKAFEIFRGAAHVANIGWIKLRQSFIRHEDPNRLCRSGLRHAKSNSSFWGRGAQTCWLGLLSTAWSRRSHPTIPRKWRDAHFVIASRGEDAPSASALTPTKRRSMARADLHDTTNLTGA